MNLKINFLEVFRKILGNQNGNIGFMGTDGNSGDGANNTAGDGGAPDNGTGGGASDISYPEGFDESLRGNQSLLKFYDKEKKAFNFANMAKSYVNAESLLGKDKINIPGKDSLPEAWDQVFDKLGRPARDKYEVKNSVAENLQADPEFFNKFLDTAHKSGLLPKQAQAVVDFFNSESATVMQRESEAKKADLQKGVQELQKEWGTNYKNNLEKASEALFAFASDEELKTMQEAGLLDNPIVTKIFHKIADSLKEDKFKTETKSLFGTSKDELNTKIAEFYKADHPYMQYNHPQKAYYQEQMLKMQQLLTKMN
jgi:hypothetical protein